MLRAIAVATALLGIGVASSVAADTPHKEDSTMSSTMKMSKRTVPEPPPVSISGIRYEVDFGGRSRGLRQTGGIIAAIDEATGEQKWTLKVYPVKFNPNKERDTQEIFITDLAASADGTKLIVGNEAGARFAIDLVTRSIKAAPAN